MHPAALAVPAHDRGPPTRQAGRPVPAIVPPVGGGSAVVKQAEGQVVGPLRKLQLEPAGTEEERGQCVGAKPRKRAGGCRPACAQQSGPHASATLMAWLLRSRPGPTPGPRHHTACMSLSVPLT